MKLSRRTFLGSAAALLPGETAAHTPKEAGVRFTFGSNSHGDGIGRLEYCVEMARRCALSRADFFVPG